MDIVIDEIMEQAATVMNKVKVSSISLGIKFHKTSKMPSQNITIEQTHLLTVQSERTWGLVTWVIALRQSYASREKRTFPLPTM